MWIAVVPFAILPMFHRRPGTGWFPMPFRDYDRRGRIYQAIGTVLAILFVFIGSAC
jgi:hypothetical protein